MIDDGNRQPSELWQSLLMSDMERRGALAIIVSAGTAFARAGREMIAGTAEQTLSDDHGHRRHESRPAVP